MSKAPTPVERSNEVRAFRKLWVPVSTRDLTEMANTGSGDWALREYGYRVAAGQDHASVSAAFPAHKPTSLGLVLAASLVAEEALTLLINRPAVGVLGVTELAE